MIRSKALEALAGVVATAAALGLVEAAVFAQNPAATASSVPTSSSAPPHPPAKSADSARATPEVAPATPSIAHPARIASYALHARLDEVLHRVDARGTITWRNASRIAVHELYLHLYLNAFKNEKSLFLRSPFHEGRSGARAEGWGYVDVRRLAARELGGIDLWPARTPGALADPEDETDVRLPLPRAIEPGETLTLELDFSAQLPAIVERTGYFGNFHFVAQWFPKLARLEPDGTWAHFSFHPQAEFYADFGDYDVTLDLPAATVVGATGHLVESREQGARRISRFQAGPVHDFAWTCWPEFVEARRRVGKVEVRLLHPPGNQRNAAIELTAAARGLERFSRLYGEYPYPTLTLVHPPDGAAAAGGMEYPTLITTGGPWYTALVGARALESVTLHELLHQWFYGIVASDETRHPFLDEGLTTYAEVSALEAFHGSGSAFDAFGLELTASSVSRALAAERAEDMPVSSPAAAFPGFRTLAALVYSRSGVALETLGRVYGRGRLERALGAFAREWRFAHPTPADFFATIRRELGNDAARALELALTERGRVDYLVRELQSAPERSPAGVFDRSDGRKTLASAPPNPERWRGRAVVLRHGTLELPVEIELTDARGARTRVSWDGRGPHRVVDFSGSAPLAFVVVDPDRRILLDDDLLNNAAAERATPTSRSFERAFYFSELLLRWFGP